METKVSVGVSNRHVHLTEETYKMLFDEELTKKNDLNQIGQFASNQTLTLKTEKTEIPNVRILGPFRSYNQIEISKTDARKFGLNPPVRDSGDVANSEKITLVTPKAEITIEGCIIAHRHVHMNTKEALELGIKDKQPCTLKVPGIKGGTLNAVFKVSDDGFFETHIDTDEAAAFALNSGDLIDLEY